MSKRSARLKELKTTIPEEIQKSEEITGNGNGKFNFRNGDIYEGEFKIQNEKIFKQGYGVYMTDNFDIYSAQWDQDNIAADLHIQYNNEMQYKGGINTKGEMTGYGIYIFPDQTIIEANWSKNKPQMISNFIEPSGFKWNGSQSENGKEILFVPGNHFWRELHQTINEEEEQIIANNGISDRLSSKSNFKNKKGTTVKKSE